MAPRKPTIDESQIGFDDEDGVPVYGPQVTGITDPVGGPAPEDRPSLKSKDEDLRNWREVWKVGKKKPYKFDDLQRGRFLLVLSQTERVADAAAAAGISYSYARQVYREDPEFAEAWEDAVQEYRARVFAEVQQRAIEGTLEPIFAGKDGELKGYKVVKSDALLIMEAKRAIPDYRDKKEIDVTTGGKPVAFPLAVPAATLAELADGYEYPTEPPNPDAPIGSEI